MTMGSAQRTRRSVVQLTSLMDLLFVLIFAFMLKTSGEVDIIANQVNTSLANELKQTKLHMQQTIKLEREFARAKERMAIEKLEKQEQRFVARISELEKKEEKFAARISELTKSLSQNLTPIIQPIKAGRWEMIYASRDRFFTAEGWSSVLVIKPSSSKTRLADGRSVTKYLATEKIQSLYGTAEETLEGHFDPDKRVLTLKTLGWTRATGRYSIDSRGDRTGLGYIRLQNQAALSKLDGWVSFPTNMTAVVSSDGRELLSGSSNHPDPQRQLTSGTWTARWLGSE